MNSHPTTLSSYLTLFANIDPIPVFSPSTWKHQTDLVRYGDDTIDINNQIYQVIKPHTWISSNSSSNPFKHKIHNLISPLILHTNSVYDGHLSAKSEANFAVSYWRLDFSSVRSIQRGESDLDVMGINRRDVVDSLASKRRKEKDNNISVTDVMNEWC